MRSLKYYFGQVPQFLAAVAGVFILSYPCYKRAWGKHGAKTNKVWPTPNEYLNGREIDSWDWDWLNKWYGNPEDGVSGETALVWADSKTLVIYNSEKSRWKTYVWSVWRNSADALKYKFPQE